MSIDRLSPAERIDLPMGPVVSKPAITAADLEPVWRLIERLEVEDDDDIGSSITIAGYAALPTLKSLLAEVAQARSTIALLEAQVTSLTEKVGDLAMERAELKCATAELNRQLTDEINSREYWKQLYKDMVSRHDHDFSET